MIRYACDCCKRELDPDMDVRYVVKLEVYPSFDPPLVAIGVKPDSGGYAALSDSRAFALNFLGKGQQGAAFAFFKPAERDGNTISGEPFHHGTSGAPILQNAIASVECRIVEIVEQGDHHIVVGEVIDAVAVCQDVEILAIIEARQHPDE